MRTPIDYNEYRAWYYFFQYNFFVRSEQGLKRNAPESRVAQFLRQLVYDAQFEHYRWEIPQIRQLRIKKRLADSDPVAPSMGHPVLYKAKGKSIRQRFMLFDFPKGHRADHIPLMYKALVVFDMLQDGLTEYSITKLLITKAETLPSISRVRTHTKWYDLLFDNSLGTFECSEITDGSAIKKYAMRVMNTSAQESATNLQGEREMMHEPIRSRIRDVHRYKRIAEVLITLAQAGRFKSFPEEIAHIK